MRDRHVAHRRHMRARWRREVWHALQALGVIGLFISFAVMAARLLGAS